MKKMKLKDLKDNQVTFYYQNPISTEPIYDSEGNDTGETKVIYGNPIEAVARIGNFSGNAEDSPFGKDLQYDQSVSTVKDLDIDEYTLLFVDTMPEIKEDGSTDTLPDYRCVCPKNDLDQNVWAISKIKR